MVVALSIGFFLATMSLLAGVGYWIWVRDVAPVTPPKLSAPELAFESSPPSADLAPWQRVLFDIGSMVPAQTGQRHPVRRNLAAGGFRQESAVPIFYGLKALCLASAPLLCAMVLYSFNPDVLAIAPAVLFSGYVGFRLPDNLLQRRIASRRQKIHLGLPDLLDLLVISVESGLSLDHALAETGRDLERLHPDISEELSVSLLEIKAGTSRADALRNLGRRVGEPELRKLTSLLVQADRFGSSISRVLRTQARYMRTRRRHRAEELAHKVGVKLIFPIFFLIMPSIFLVTAGPALLHLFSNLAPLVGGM